MHISVATATYYNLPFDYALEIIAQAGFEWIELDLYWERGKWAMAQHLKGTCPREVVWLVHQAGLRVASIHDGGGVMEDSNTVRGFINPALPDYLDQLGYAPECIVFHTPHIEGEYNERWWQAISSEVVSAAEGYRNEGCLVTIENMPCFDGYYVPLTAPKDLLSFVSQNELQVTVDTTHYAQMGVDIAQAATLLRDRVATVHLSDYRDGASHVFVGDGSLDFARFLGALDVSALRSITLECSPAFFGESASELDKTALVDRLRVARSRLSEWLPVNV